MVDTFHTPPDTRKGGWVLELFLTMVFQFSITTIFYLFLLVFKTHFSPSGITRAYQYWHSRLTDYCRKWNVVFHPTWKAHEKANSSLCKCSYTPAMLIDSGTCDILCQISYALTWIPTFSRRHSLVRVYQRLPCRICRKHYLPTFTTQFTRIRIQCRHLFKCLCSSTIFRKFVFLNL